MKLKIKSLTIICLLMPFLFIGQIKILKNIRPSVLANKEEKALFFIDFWATWCGPCINASKYLESLQQQYPDKFYVISISKEGPEAISRFAEKHDMKLAVVADYDGETFSENEVTSLPYGILFNADGHKLWEGHPADFKYYHLNGYLELKGSLQSIIAYALNSSDNQIEIPSHLNKHYSVSFEEGTRAYTNKERYILKALKLKKIKSEKEGDVIVLDITEPKFWDTKQIDWGSGNQRYLIGNSEIQADNVTLNDITYKLSTLLEMPILFKGDNTDNEENLHDWQIHYKYFELMSSNLSDYGISVEKKVATYPQYVYAAK